MKWVIRKHENGRLYASMYMESVDEYERTFRHLPSDVREQVKSSLPITVNGYGGYTSFVKDDTFQRIVDTPDSCDNPLTLEERFPKNDSSLVYGWVSPDGDTYMCSFEEHISCAACICKYIYGLDSYSPDIKLQELGWAEIQKDRKGNTWVYTNNFKVTRKQADRLMELGLDKNSEIKVLIDASERYW